ncbi:hypothetical protein, partial [Klebsiella pneumoniae]|uniref:hypothetical protein n=4 Tax=Klebsiella pneumoniae TaxID=573 RepID=UPI001C466040
PPAHSPEENMVRQKCSGIRRSYLAPLNHPANRMLSNHTTASLQNKYFLTATFLIQRTRLLPISSYTQATTIRHALLLLEPYIPPQCCYAISEKMAKEI